MNFYNQSIGSQNKFYCNVCRISFSTEGEYALHEFTNKHCDNLLKTSKNKPKKSKPKEVKIESTLVNKEEVKVNVDTSLKNHAGYGHFVFGETYTSNSESKEFNTECNFHLQKYANNSLKDFPASHKMELEEKSSLQFAPSVPSLSKTSFKRIKKEYVRMCQICNLTLLTVSEYESHLKSSEHSHNLKMTGMGVSAQFVKETSDLHKTEINENSISNDQHEKNYGEKIVFVENFTEPPKIYCNICELFLNSERQYNSHIKGKPHNNFAKKKAQIEALNPYLEKPNLKKHYCYTCKLLLNNLSQYNDHTNGKKHNMNYKKLMRNRTKISPDKVGNTLKTSKLDLNNHVIYPEKYEKSVPETETANNRIHTNEWKISISNEVFADNISNLKNVKTPVNDQSDLEVHANSQSHQEPKELTFWNCERQCFDENISHENNSQFQLLNLGKTNANVLEKSCRVVLHADKMDSNAPGLDSTDVGNEELILEKKGLPSSSATKDDPNTERFDNSLVKTPEATYNNIISVDQSEEENILNMGKSFKCTLCCENFVELLELEHHLAGEEHARKIQESRENIESKDNDVIQILSKDETLVKENEFGRVTCSTCSVTTEDVTEPTCHHSDAHHQSSEEDLIKKKKIEIGCSVSMNGDGRFVCKICQEGYTTLVNYNQHLHTVKHAENVAQDTVKSSQTKDRDLLPRHKRLTQIYTSSGRKKRDTNWWRRKWGKNSGAKTKISDAAKDSHTSRGAGIPNPEPETAPSGQASSGVANGVEKGECKRWKAGFDFKPKRVEGRVKHYGAKHARNLRGPHLPIPHWANSQPGRLGLFAPPAPHAVQNWRHYLPGDFPRGRDSNRHYHGCWQPWFVPG